MLLELAEQVKLRLLHAAASKMSLHAPKNEKILQGIDWKHFPRPCSVWSKCYPSAFCMEACAAERAVRDKLIFWPGARAEGPGPWS
jgi:hypothetical protein